MVSGQPLILQSLPDDQAWWDLLSRLGLVTQSLTSVTTKPPLIVSSPGTPTCMDPMRKKPYSPHRMKGVLMKAEGQSSNSVAVCSWLCGFTHWMQRFELGFYSWKFCHCSTLLKQENHRHSHCTPSRKKASSEPWRNSILTFFQFWNIMSETTMGINLVRQHTNHLQGTWFWTYRP